MLRRKSRDSLKAEFVFCGGKCVSDGKNTRIKDSYDITGIGFLHHLTLIRHHLLRLGELNLLASLYMKHLHTGGEFAGTDTHKCNTVAMILIHVCLNLEYKRRKIFLERIHDTGVRHASCRSIGHLQKMLQKSLHTEVCQG